MTYSEAKACIKATDKDTVKELIELYGEDLVNQYQKEGYDLSSMEEAYQGEYRSDEDFAREMAEQCGYMEKDVAWPFTCIDWEHAARELMYDYFEIDGHYFRSL